MKKNKRKRFVFAVLTGFLMVMPIRSTGIMDTAYAAQVSDPHDSKLSAFDIAPGTLSPAFSPDIFEYTSTVDAGVTDVRVQAEPRSSSAVIASIEGRNGLHPGVNIIKATCSAQDNTFTVYTITLTVGSADAGTQTGTQSDTNPAGDAGNTQPNEVSGEDAGEDASESNQTGEDSDTQPDTGGEEAGSLLDDGTADVPTGNGASSRLIGVIGADGTVVLNGASYQLSNNFSYGSITQEVPDAFGQGSVQIGSSSYSTLYHDTGNIHLVYMENTDGNGSTGFYYYDENQNAVERFKYTGIGDNFVVFISSARQELPVGYQETELTLPSGKEVAAYQNLSSEELRDYYLIYGVNSDGSNGWYLYDNTQGTYMRYANAFALQQQEPEEEEEVARTVSLAKYNTLNEKYTELKNNRVKIVSILVIVIVLLIILFTAILLRSREDEELDEEDDRKERIRVSKRSKRQKKQADPISKSSLAAGRSLEENTNKNTKKKVTKTFTQEPSRKVQRQPMSYQDDISSPEEIRAQVGREQLARKGYASETEPSPAYSQPKNMLKKNQPASSQDSVQIAAERMRQSVKYQRNNQKQDMEETVQEHDPMDDWDMEEPVRRKSSRSGKSARRRRGSIEEEVEIMDLNDL